MMKLIKHELKDSSRFVIPVIIFILGISMFPIIKGAFDKNISDGFNVAIIIVLILILLIVPLFFVFGYVYGSFSKRMFSKEGYLTLTLPYTSYEIIFAKLVATLIWSMMILLLAVLLSLLLVRQFMSLREMFDAVKEILAAEGIPFTFDIMEVLVNLLNVVKTSLVVWFAMSLGRIRPFNAFRYSSILLLLVFLYLNGSLSQSTLISQSTALIRVLFNGGLSFVLFVSTGYILEEKIDLE